MKYYDLFISFTLIQDRNGIFPVDLLLKKTVYAGKNPNAL